MNQQTSCGGLSAGGVPSSAAVLSGGGAQPRSGSPDLRRTHVAVALLDYVAQSPAELAFRRGDSIRNVRAAAPPHAASQGSAWWRGELHGEEGLFCGDLFCLSTLPEAAKVSTSRLR